MNRTFKSWCCFGVSVVFLMLLSGCATPGFDQIYQTDGSVGGSTIAGFKMGQSVEEAHETMLELRYKPAPRRGAETLFENLLDKTQRDRYIGRTVSLEKMDRTYSTVYRVDLKFNELFTLENVIVSHTLLTESEENEILQSYLVQFPMLVFMGSEDGETHNRMLNKKEKITNANYHFDGGRYAYFHLNLLRTHKGDGMYNDSVKFNSHDSTAAAQDKFKIRP